MSERWKYQIKKGLPFGIGMPVITTAFDWFGTEATFTEAFFSLKFLGKLAIFLVLGVFAIGYSYWREREKNEMYNKN